MAKALELTEQVLDACRGLGRARVVLRNALGLAEWFGDLQHLAVSDGWAHLCSDSVHFHLHCHTIASVRFIEPAADAVGHAACALWFADDHGAPLLLVVLDQVKDSTTRAQREAFEDLRRTFGPVCQLRSVDALPSSAALH